MSKEELEKLEREKYVVERKLTAAMHKEKRLQSELKRLTRSERTHRLCTRAGMLETFLKEPTTLTDDDVMELLTFIFHSEAVQKKLDLLICRVGISARLNFCRRLAAYISSFVMANNMV